MKQNTRYAEYGRGIHDAYKMKERKHGEIKGR